MLIISEFHAVPPLPRPRLRRATAHWWLQHRGEALVITSAVRQPFQLQPSTRETSETALTSTESKRQRTPLVVGGSVFMKHESFCHNLSNLDQMTVTKSVMIFFSPADNWLGITQAAVSSTVVCVGLEPNQVSSAGWEIIYLTGS